MIWIYGPRLTTTDQGLLHVPVVDRIKEGIGGPPHTTKPSAWFPACIKKISIDLEGSLKGLETPDDFFWRGEHSHTDNGSPLKA